MTIDVIGGVSSNIHKKWRKIKQFAMAAGGAPISSPVGKGAVLSVAYPAIVVTALATGELFHLYAAARARVVFIDAHRLPLSPPDPIPALVCGILGAGVTLLLIAAAWEVAAGRSITDLSRRAVKRFSACIKSTPPPPRNSALTLASCGAPPTWRPRARGDRVMPGAPATDRIA